MNVRMSGIASVLSSKHHHACVNHDVCDADVCFGDTGGMLVSREHSSTM